MKKLLLMIVMAALAVTMQAQKFALVDMEYILKNIPAYERANEQLNQVSKKWQAEVEAVQIEAQSSSLKSRRRPVRMPLSRKNRRLLS